MKKSAAWYFSFSNLLTYLSVLAGLGAVFSAHALRSWPLAGGLIALSALVDTFDGRFARLFTRNQDQKDFGVEIDSLGDAVAFGLTPVICLLLLTPLPSATAALLWGAGAFFYVIASLTRLGAYNLQTMAHEGFVGLPTTVAALLWSSAFLARPSVWASTALLFACGLMVVSPLRIPRPRGWGFLAFAAWPILLIVLHGARARF